MTTVESLSCPKCRAAILDPALLNQADLRPCPVCATPIQIEVFPALFRAAAAGSAGELVLVEGESSCFYHPQKKAIVPCDVCGRFLCALCDCEVHGRHCCPACLELAQKRKRITGIENSRAVHARQALLLSLLPFMITGIFALIIALRYRKEPGSLVKPLRWAFPLALIFGSLQIVASVALIVLLVIFNR